MGHPPYSPDLAPNDIFFFVPAHQKQTAWTPIFLLEKAGDAFKTTFWRCLKRNAKNAITHALNACKSVYTDRNLMDESTIFDGKPESLGISVS